MHLALSTASWDRKIDGKGKPFLLPCCTLNLTILNQDSMKQLIVFCFFFFKALFPDFLNSNAWKHICMQNTLCYKVDSCVPCESHLALLCFVICVSKRDLVLFFRDLWDPVICFNAGQLLKSVLSHPVMSNSL